MLRDLIIAAIRTGTAAAVGFAIAYLIGLGVEVPADFESTLTVVVFGLVVAGYNAAVGLLERRVHPLFGVLLGVPKAPAYPDGQPAAPDERGHSLIETILVALLVSIVVTVVLLWLR